MVLYQISADELHKMVIDQVVNAGVVYMIGTELGQLRQEPVRERLTVHFLDDICHRGLIFLKESLLKVVA